MPPVAGDALFQIIRVGAAVQAESIIVCFQRHQITAGQAIRHYRRQYAQVGGDRHAPAIRRQDAVPAARHVVACWERRDPETPDIQRLPSIYSDRFHGGRQRSTGFQRFQRTGAAVNRQRIFL